MALRLLAGAKKTTGPGISRAAEYLRKGNRAPKRPDRRAICRAGSLRTVDPRLNRGQVGLLEEKLAFGGNWGIAPGYNEFLNSTNNLTMPKKDIDANHIFMEFIDEKDMVSTMNIYYENPEPGEPPGTDDDIDEVLGWMEEFIGIVPTQKFFRLEDFIEDPKDKRFIPLTQLEKFLQEKGVDIHESSRKLLDFPVSYTRTPKNLSNQTEYREDIEWGWTKCAKILQDYEDFDSDEVVQTEADGISVGCIFFRTDNLKEPDKDKRISVILDSLKQALTQNAGKDSFEIIGEAHGKYFEYLDIIGYDIGKTLQAAFEFFKTTQVPFSGYHPLRKRCGCARLSGENKWIPYRGKEEINPLLKSFWQKDETSH